MSNHLYDARIFPTKVEVRKRGSSLVKPISVKDFIGVLSESAQNVFNYSRSERIRLPENTYLTEYAGNILNLCMYFKEHPAKVSHIRDEKPKEFEIMMPNIVLHLSLKVSNNGSRHEVIGAYYYVTNVEVNNLPNTVPGPLRDVFGHVPFPNFYDNFTQCFGRNTMISQVDGGDLRIFKMYYDIIEASPFNNDLRLYNVRYNYDSYRDWFKKLHEVYKAEQRFPYELITI